MTGCRTVPYTERTQLMLSGEASESQLGIQAFNEYKAKYPRSANSQQNAALARVAEAITGVLNRPEYSWEFVVFESDEANAFCLPGGKVAVMSGIFRYMTNDAELAAVVGHEIGHALARHGGERLSWDYMSTLGLGIITASGYNSSTVAALYGLTTDLAVAKPFSRQDEYEADKIGLYLLADAGYQPGAALTFWKKFSAASSAGVSEWLSTHPSGSNRIAEIEKTLPDAIQRYYKAPIKRNFGSSIY